MDGMFDLPYYYGMLPAQDAEKLLRQEGDFLLMTTDKKLVLAVRHNGRIEQLRVRRLKCGYRITEKADMIFGKWILIELLAV